MLMRSRASRVAVISLLTSLTSSAGAEPDTGEHSPVGLAGPQTLAPPPIAPRMPQADATIRRGLTFDAGIGPAMLRISGCGGGQDCDPRYQNATDYSGVALSFGIGGWLRSNLALSLRIAGVTIRSGWNYTTNANESLVDIMVIHPHLQVWVTDHIWAGVGLGWATSLDTRKAVTDSLANTLGAGFHLRAGYTFLSLARSSFNVSLEATGAAAFPGVQFVHGAGNSSKSIALVVGYQYL